MSKIQIKIGATAAIALFLAGTSALTTFAHEGSVVQEVNAAPEANADPVKTCMAAQPAPVKKKNKPIKLLFKGLASEAGTDMHSMLQDSIFVFSAKDVDPYDKSAPTNKPYTAFEIRYVDGSAARLIRYPDNSYRIDGGFADGTIIAPNGPGTFIIAYPNGVRGKVVKSGTSVTIYRPDNTVTTVKKDMSGDYSIENSKLGFIGTARSDTEGMQYEFHSKDF